MLICECFNARENKIFLKNAFELYESCKETLEQSPNFDRWKSVENK